MTYQEPPYLAHIRLIGDNDHKALQNPRDHWTTMQRLWDDLEDAAKNEGYDIFHAFGDACVELKHELYLVEPSAPPDELIMTDEKVIREKDRDYGGSWMKRGGQGAFMMLARKWDRIAKQMEQFQTIEVAIKSDKRPEGILDDIRDLRRYLILVQAELMVRSAARQH